MIDEPVFSPSENPHPVLRVSLDGELLYANPAAEKIVSTWSCDGAQQIPNALQALIDEALTTGEIAETEMLGERATYLLSLKAFSDRGYADVYGLSLIHI